MSQTSNQASQTPNLLSQTPNRVFLTLDPKSGFPDPKSGLPYPKSSLPDPESGLPDPKSGLPGPEPALSSQSNVTVPMSSFRTFLKNCPIWNHRSSSPLGPLPHYHNITKLNEHGVQEQTLGLKKWSRLLTWGDVFFDALAKLMVEIKKIAQKYRIDGQIMAKKKILKHTLNKKLYSWLQKVCKNV